MAQVREASVVLGLLLLRPYQAGTRGSLGTHDAGPVTWLASVEPGLSELCVRPVCTTCQPG